MIPIIKIALRQELDGRHFKKAVDLGCGWGSAARIIKPHVSYFIGVDHSERNLIQAERTKCYDELIYEDIRLYEMPSDVDVVFMMDVIEHIQHEHGEQLLKGMYAVPNIILSTPRTFFKNPSWDPHVCLWTQQELHEFQFQTRILHGVFQPDIIFATRYLF